MAIPVTLFIVHAFVIGCLALGKSDLTLNKVIFPIQRGANGGVAFLVNALFKFLQLTMIK